MTTVIAVRQGKKIYMASDSQATGGTTPFTVNKIYKIGGYTFAAAGTLSAIQKTARTLKKDKKPASITRFVKAAEPHGEYLVALRRRLYSIGGDGSVIELGEGEPAAVGSGGDFALGAMTAGASPLQAVQIATIYDVYSGGEITEITVK